MRKLRYYSIFIILILFTSCGIDNAESVANEFHTALMDKDFEKITDELISDEGLEITPKKDWIDLFEKLHEKGKIKSIEREEGFKSSVKNGITTVTLYYKIKFKGTKNLYEKIILTKEGKDSDFKVAGVSFHENLDKLKDKKDKS